jgi:hypothetical protein
MPEKRDQYNLRNFGPANPLRIAVEDHIDKIPRRKRPRVSEFILQAIREKLERDTQKEGGK